jgi:PKD repeat protein
MKFNSLLTVFASVLLFTSCVKEPTACFTFSNDNPEVFEVVTFNNCSEDAESYDWTIGTDFFESSSSQENPQFSWDVAGTYNVELEAHSKNEKKSDVTSNAITVTDICYECEYEILGTFITTDVCASSYFSKENFENAVESYEDSGYDCRKQ